MKKTAEKKSKTKFFIPIAVLVLAALGCAGILLTQGQEPNSEPTEPGVEQTEQEEQATGDSDTDAQEESAVPELTDHQQQLIAQYSTSEQDVIGLLRSGRWTSLNSNTALIFEEASYSVKTSNGTTQHSYAIASVEESSTQAEGEEIDTLSVYTFTFENEDNSYTMTLRASQTHTGSMNLSSKAFPNDIFTVSSFSQELKIENLPAQVTAAMGGNEENMKAALLDYCIEHYPTATTATSKGSLIQDFIGNTASTYFALDNTSSTVLILTYNVADGTFEVTNTI